MVGNLPFLKNRLESDEPSHAIRKITHNVRLHIASCSISTRPHLSEFQVQSVADQVKQSDTKNIKHGIITLIPQNYFPLDENGNPTVNAHHHISIKDPAISKSWRGWGNPITSRLLCPVDYIAQFKANPDEYAAHLARSTFINHYALQHQAEIVSGGDPAQRQHRGSKVPSFLV